MVEPHRSTQVLLLIELGLIVSSELRVEVLQMGPWSQRCLSGLQTASFGPVVPIHLLPTL